jgi:hypothetical protein
LAGWDHYYSDAAGVQALPVVFETPRTVSTRAAIRKVGDPVRGIHRRSRSRFSISRQVAAARQNVEELASARITAQAIDLLDHTRAFPEGFDAIWMSHSGELLRSGRAAVGAAAAMRPDSAPYILDTFGTGTRSRPAAGQSFYFTCLANGDSRMYKIRHRRDDRSRRIASRKHRALGIADPAGSPRRQRRS